jgi:hypothetical protein
MSNGGRMHWQAGLNSGGAGRAGKSQSRSIGGECPEGSARLLSHWHNGRATGLRMSWPLTPDARARPHATPAARTHIGSYRGRARGSSEVLEEEAPETLADVSERPLQESLERVRARISEQGYSLGRRFLYCRFYLAR